MFSKAGEIFVKTNHFNEAIRCFKQTDKIADIADAYYKLKDYKNALCYYEQTKNISRILDCYLK